MPNLNALRALTTEMYLHTSAGRRTSQHASLTVSETAVRRAPVQKLSPAEQAGRMGLIQRQIARELLTGPISAETLRAGLANWHSARIS